MKRTYWSLEPDYPFLTIIHPAHLAYMRHLPLNSMKYFLQSLDKLDAQQRHEIIYGAFWAVIESVETGSPVWFLATHLLRRAV